MSQGKEYLVRVSTTSAGVKAEVELQGDLTINSGKSLASKIYKNGEESAQSNSGFSISFEMGNTAPLSTTEAVIWELHDTGDIGYFEVRSTKTGGLLWTFAGRVAIPTVAAPASGVTSVTVNVNAEGTVARSVVPSSGG